MRNRIPEVSKGNDIFYWSEIYPCSYSVRNKIIADWGKESEDEPNYILDGEVEVKLEDNKHIITCTRCKQPYGGLGRPRMFGNIDVGVELVYYCRNCNEGHYRVYTDSINSIVAKIGE